MFCVRDRWHRRFIGDVVIKDNSFPPWQKRQFYVQLSLVDMMHRCGMHKASSTVHKYSLSTYCLLLESKAKMHFGNP